MTFAQQIIADMRAAQFDIESANAAFDRMQKYAEIYSTLRRSISHWFSNNPHEKPVIEVARGQLPALFAIPISKLKGDLLSMGISVKVERNDTNVPVYSLELSGPRYVLELLNETPQYGNDYYFEFPTWGPPFNKNSLTMPDGNEWNPNTVICVNTQHSAHASRFMSEMFAGYCDAPVLHQTKPVCTTFYVDGLQQVD